MTTVEAPNPNGTSRELYLIAKDTAEELAVSPEVLSRMSAALGVGSSRSTNLRVYTAREIAALRVLQGWMTDLEVSPALAARIMRKVAKLRSEGAKLPGEG